MHITPKNMTPRKLSERGLLALIRHEGLVPGPYLDIKNVWTFGIGHTTNAGPPDPARMRRGMPTDLDTGIYEAFQLFCADITAYEAAVLRAVNVQITPHAFDALVSFHYNTGAIARARLTQHLCAGNMAAAAHAFLNWRRPPAIKPRREAERTMFLHGQYPTGPIPIWSVDPQGWVDRTRPIQLLPEDDALALLRTMQTTPLAVSTSLLPPSTPVQALVPSTAPGPSTATSSPASPQSWWTHMMTFLAPLIWRA